MASCAVCRIYCIGTAFQPAPEPPLSDASSVAANRRTFESRFDSVDKLCRQDYTLVADILHLACFEKAAAGRSCDKISYFVGLNEHILESKADEIYNGGLVCSMGDGTRTSMLIEKAVHPVYGRPYLVGEAFPADVRLWPSGPQGGKGMMPMPQTVEKVYEYISRVREKTGDHEMSHEVVTEALNCMSDRTRPMLVYSLFPEPSKGFSSVHNLLYWAKLVQVWHDHSVRAVGFATDSCSTGLGAGTALMTPTTKDVEAKVPFLGLDDRDFIYCARWVGGRTMADGYHFDYYLKWYVPALHQSYTCVCAYAYPSPQCLRLLPVPPHRLDAWLLTLSSPILPLLWKVWRRTASGALGAAQRRLRQPLHPLQLRGQRQPADCRHRGAQGVARYVPSQPGSLPHRCDQHQQVS